MPSRLVSRLRQGLGLIFLTALILTARCANHEEVFVNGNIYFTDADCYSRMTRVRLCLQHPGLVLRHHSFENFPQGVTPHTTVPLDYLIAGLSVLLRSFAINAVDLAGAVISPILAVLGGWFLWWWMRRMKFRYCWAGLILYAISPILVHGADLGRPDHHSLAMLMVMVALCAEWSWQIDPRQRWSVVSAAAWATAIWVSAYEPLLLFLGMNAALLMARRPVLFGRSRRNAWIVLGAILFIALAIERRLPSLGTFDSGAWQQQQGWARTIGELASVSPLDGIWFRWAGYLLLVVPVLVWLAYRKRLNPPQWMVALLLLTFCLTIWQARWGYFFLLIFVVVLPAVLEAVPSRGAVWMAFILSLLPVLRDWDGRFWPNEQELARQLEHRREDIELRALSREMLGAQTQAFLAPWWLSPAIAYWSGQPGVAGSSHESLAGIVDSARFFLAAGPHDAREILRRRAVSWVVAYDAERVTANSCAILGTAPPAQPLCRVLDRAPAQVTDFLTLVSQNGTAKLFQVGNNR